MNAYDLLDTMVRIVKYVAPRLLVKTVTNVEEVGQVIVTYVTMVM